MKKITKIVFFLCIVLVAFQGRTQVFSEGFETGLGTFENAEGNDVDWEVNTSLFHEGSQSIFNEYETNNDNVVFQTAPIDLTSIANPQLSFWQIAKTEGSFDDAIVEVSTDGGTTFTTFVDEDYLGDGVLFAPGTFNEDSYPDWGTTDITPENTWWKNEFFDLSDYATSTVVIRFRLTSDGSVLRSGWFLDDVQVIEVTCPKPTDIIADNLTPYTADVSWTIGGSETEWEIIYGAPGFDLSSEGTTVQDTDGTIGETITGLSPDTEYEFYVRAICGTDDNSIWSTVGSFMTTPTCPQPTDLTVGTNTSTSVDISWTEGATETAWNIIYGPVDFVPGDGTGTEITGVTDNPYTITGLTEGEDYDVYVQADCGSGDLSTYAGPASFHMPGPGETCGNPIEVTALPYSTTDDTSNYGDDYTGGTTVDCETPSYYLNGDDVVYAYTASADTSIDINISDLTGNYSGLFVYASCDDIGVECIASYGSGFSSDDFSIEELIVTGGTTYYIVISTWATPQSTGYTLDIIENTCINLQADFSIVDDCESGTPQFFIDVDVSDLGSASSVSISDGMGQEENNVVAGIYSFGPYPNGTDVTISVDSDDDSNCFVESQTLTQNACPPDNNTPCDAFVATINGDQFCANLNEGTLEAAGASNTPGGCAVNGAPDVWYKFTAQATTHMTALLNGAGTDSSSLYSAIYSGTDPCENLTQLFCSDEFANFGSSPNMVATGLTIGETYWVRVFGDIGDEDDFNLCITTPEYNDFATCDEVEPFCAPTDASGDPEPLIFPNGYFYLTETTAESGIDYGCLNSQPNPAWYYLQVDQDGDLDFEIIQNTAFDANGNPIGDGLDVDFVAWGPFDNIDEICDNLDNDHRVPGVSFTDYDGCDYSADDEEYLGIDNAVQGEIYVVLITNFRQLPGYISLGQTNFGDGGAGTTDCTILESVLYSCGEEGVDETILTTQYVDAVAYVWYLYDEANETYNLVPDALDPSLTVTEEGLYKLVSYDATGVPSEEIFNVVYALSPKDQLDIDGDGVTDDPEQPLEVSLCGAPNLDFDATPLNPADFGTINYSWKDENGNELATTPDYTVTTEGEYTVTISGQVLGENGVPIAGTFCDFTQTIIVSAADFIVDIGNDQVFCGVNSYTITADITGEDPANATFVWSDANGVIAGETSQTLTVSESGVYTVEVTIEGCSPGPKTVDITFNRAPEIDLGEDIDTCDTAGIILDATPSNVGDVDDVHFTWTYNGTQILDGTGAANATVNVEDHGYGTYEVIAYTNDPNCTSNPEGINIQQKNPSINLSVNDQDNLFCIGETAIFTAELTDETSDEIDFVWYKNGEIVPGETGSTLSVTVEELTDYSVEASFSGCTATTSLSIGTYEGGCEIPKGISPGTTVGINDCLDLTFLNDRTGISSLKLYNRYGRLVFEKGNYNDDWCGQDKDGNDLVTGTYYYVLELKGNDEVFGNNKKGWIYVNRTAQ